ncbi:MAG TPA: transposase, partial [Campylobacterales bacterium]|nr:transposase [Campylobacterales bacterium]
MNNKIKYKSNNNIVYSCKYHQYNGKNIGSQAIQNITQRIENGYQRFFDYLKNRKKEKVSPPNFKKVKRYKSFTLKGKVGYKIENNTISLKGYRYKFWLSRVIEGQIKPVTFKRDSLGDVYICISLEQEEKKSNRSTGNSVG